MIVFVLCMPVYRGALGGECNGCALVVNSTGCALVVNSTGCALVVNSTGCALVVNSTSGFCVRMCVCPVQFATVGQRSSDCALLMQCARAFPGHTLCYGRLLFYYNCAAPCVGVMGCGCVCEELCCNSVLSWGRTFRR
jgi:hypothetical protein